MILFKFWSAFLFYSSISLIGITLALKPNVILLLRNSTKFDWCFIVFLFSFLFIDDVFERITMTPEEREIMIKRANSPLTKRQIITLSAGFIFIVLSPFYIIYIIKFLQSLTENLDQIGNRISIFLLIFLWWLMKSKKLWKNYHATKSKQISIS